MTLWQGIILGLVQGLTEFLPVSSSGHLRVLEVVTGVHTPGVFVEVALHVATLGSVLVMYGPRLWAIARGVLARRPAELRMAGLLALATVPAGVIGVVFHRQVEAAASLVLVGAGFIVTGLMNWSTRRLAGSRSEPTVGGAVGIGFAQALAAVFRGVSRSGSTVCAALWGGLGPVAAAEFSFLLAIPVIAGAALIESRHMAVNIAAVGAVPLAVSFALAFASGIWSIRFLVALLKRGRFYAFAPYNWIVGVLTIAYAVWRG
ncbi:MAG TPA: undecaprenyl-diphosphate phosphatase [Gemmatimonadales bacterium]|jgi:undecaprenyl-diphosphatase|nr:undecaprenyl-diphosphate phosphatase [Gemmatimonadales bacterium]